MPRILEPIPRADMLGPGAAARKSRAFDGGWARAAPACLVAGAAARMGASARSGSSVHDAPPSGGVGEDLGSRGAFLPGAELCCHGRLKPERRPCRPARGCEEGRSGALRVCPARETAASERARSGGDRPTELMDALPRLSV